MMHAGDLAEMARLQEAEIAAWADEMNESTRLTWLWALLFGPLYFAAHGFRSQAVLVLLLDLMLVGLLAAPFLAYLAWRQRGAERAEWLSLMLRSRAAAS